MQSSQRSPQRTAPPDPRRNLILRALPDEEYQRLTASMEPVSLKVRDKLYQRDGDIEAVYFPINGALSLLATVEGEAAIEVATIGYEGMSGLPAFLGTPTSLHECFCQIEGQAMCLPTDRLRKILQGDGALHDVLHRYVQATVAQLSQGVACNRLHSTEERCARWLMQSRDRVGADEFTLTQDFLAQMLGVRRGTVSLTAGVLQQAGLIRYSRGRMTILDPAGLHQVACDCYDIIQAEFRRVGLLPHRGDEVSACGA
ncbi:Crp/Fnr family transcriptional regulator [Modestobacter excelsi]|uniref:Crp/Fnr family transcriptional regulator n=1 Tax=Modestobacter excelsi TaxID=2213161 RepID=UPI00110CDD62|nr:Crp/Fnr family transcriptional regulator [Modestobacter excelsi]